MLYIFYLLIPFFLFFQHTQHCGISGSERHTDIIKKNKKHIKALF